MDDQYDLIASGAETDVAAAALETVKHVAEIWAAAEELELQPKEEQEQIPAYFVAVLLDYCRDLLNAEKGLIYWRVQRQKLLVQELVQELRLKQLEAELKPAQRLRRLKLQS
jgi:hypothetical protein